STAPANYTAGTAFATTVTVLDANNNPATAYRGTVHFTSSDSAAVLPADYTFVAADNGVHTFSNLAVRTAGAQTVTAADKTSASVSGTASLTVLPGAAAQVRLSAPATGVSGTAFNLTVTALDAFGNVATTYTSTLHFTSTDSAAALPADYPFTAPDQGIP